MSSTSSNAPRPKATPRATDTKGACHFKAALAMVVVRNKEDQAEATRLIKLATAHGSPLAAEDLIRIKGGDLLGFYFGTSLAPTCNL